MNELMQKLWLLSIVAWFIGHTSLATAQVNDASVRLNGPARLSGTGRYRPGEWGMISVRLANPGDQDTTAQAVSFFERDKTTQFGCEALVPAQSIRTVSHPIRVPENVDVDVTRLDLQTTLVEESAAGEVIQRQRDGQLFPSHFVPLARSVPATVMVSRDARKNQHIYEAVIAVRTANNLDRRVGMLTDDPYPANPLAYSGTEQLIIADDSLAVDVAAAQTIREWILDGGHLWVFLESVGQDTLEVLLGNHCRLEYVDRVTLPEVTIVPTKESAVPGETRAFEEPIPMVRALVDDLEVTHTAGGWPAAFQQRLGRGRILFTALAARGWIRTREQADPQPQDPAMSSNYIATLPLKEATAAFMQPPPQRPLLASDLKPYLYDRIGYRVAERAPVTGVLLLFCSGILAGGIWLARRGRLERLLWIVPVFSVTAVGLLGLMGMQARQGMSDSVSSVQFINLDAQQDTVHVSGLAGLYQRDKGDFTLSGSPRASMRPERFEREASLRRLVWSSSGGWHWENLPLDAGLRFAPFQFGLTPQSQARITGSFGPDGFRGTLDTGPFQNLTDLLIATPSQQTLALTIADNGRVSGGSGTVQQPGNYISESLLTDEQRRRQDVLRELLRASYRQNKYPDQPTLIAWADPLESGLRFADHVDQSGTALLTLPVQWEHPEPGTRVRIPAPFLVYQSVASAKFGLTTVLDRRSGLWRETTLDKQALLRFQIPGVVRSLEVETVTLTLDVRAASRTVEIFLGEPEELVPVAKLDGPLGVTTLEIDDPQALVTDESGGLHVLVTVSPVTFDKGEDARISDQQEKWLIHSLQMELTGQTQPAGSEN